MSFRKLFIRTLDHLVHPEIYLLWRPWPAFQVCGYAGLASAVTLAISSVICRGLSLWVMTGIILIAVLTFFGLVMATKIITGGESIIYYHHEIAVIIMAALLLWLLRQPVLPYLDVTILGIGLFLVFGRAGCLMVGCCHGRPHRWGVCYREEHANAGFTSYYVGVRLFPIQAVESLWVLCVLAAGITFVLSGRPPGEALAWYVVTYDLGRFCFEFMRGDAERPYHWGFSQPQWISLLLMCFVIWGELIGVLPLHLWHIGATACLVTTMVAIAFRRGFQRTAKHRLLHPRHVKEVAEAMAMVSSSTTEANPVGQWTILPRMNSIPIHIGVTSLGIQISGGKVSDAAGDAYHYAISCRDGSMTEEMARILAGLILQLRRTICAGEFVKGNQNVFHLLIHPTAPRA